jgi:hypothetical protein
VGSGPGEKQIWGLSSKGRPDKKKTLHQIFIDVPKKTPNKPCLAYM